MQWTLRVVAAGVIAACGFAAPVAGGQTVASASVSGIVSDPNRRDDPEYIVRLIGRVVTVSVETVQIVESLPPLGLPLSGSGL